MHDDFGGQEAADRAAKEVESTISLLRSSWKPVSLEDLMFPESHPEVLMQVPLDDSSASKKVTKAAQRARVGGTTRTPKRIKNEWRPIHLAIPGLTQLIPGCPKTSQKRLHNEYEVGPRVSSRGFPNDSTLTMIDSKTNKSGPKMIPPIVPND